MFGWEMYGCGGWAGIKFNNGFGEIHLKIIFGVTHLMD